MLIELLAHDQVGLGDKNATAIAHDYARHLFDDDRNELGEAPDAGYSEHMDSELFEAVHITRRVIVDSDGRTGPNLSFNAASCNRVRFVLAAVCVKEMLHL